MVYFCRSDLCRRIRRRTFSRKKITSIPLPDALYGLGSRIMMNALKGSAPALAVITVAATTYLSGVVSPPSLMDDVDAVQAQIAKNMLTSGDWVTARLDGIPYMEKPPLKYWLICFSYLLLGIHDWAARLPIALSAIALCFVTMKMGKWASSDTAGIFSGLILATCVGLWLFTRILIADVCLTLAITVATWSFLRSVDRDEQHPRRWSYLLWSSLGLGFLLKGLLAFVLPLGSVLFYLAVTHQLRLKSTWSRLAPFRGTAIVCVIILPWIVLATVRNPPYFDFTLKSSPGQYHGFFWFFFLNEHVFRFLNLRYPRDYNTVPRIAFWAYHLIWLFPWSVYLPGIIRLPFRLTTRAGRLHLLAVCWIGVTLGFFTLSTTQEYYSMPCYPAFALLLGGAMAGEETMHDQFSALGSKLLGAVSVAAAIVCFGMIAMGWSYPGHSDIGEVVTPHETTLALGRARDLTFGTFAYFRTPLVIAGLGFLVGAAGTLGKPGRRRVVAPVCMMLLFFQAGRLALKALDPYLSSRDVATVLRAQEPGTVVIDDQYYNASSVFFYAGLDSALLLNGRKFNLEYGSYALNTPSVFITDSELATRWASDNRYYLIAFASASSRLEKLLGPSSLHVLQRGGQKILLTNDAGACQNPAVREKSLAEVIAHRKAGNCGA